MSAPASGRIETWKIEMVRRYLERQFPEARIDDYQRGGGSAQLFQVMVKHVVGQRRVGHQVLVMRQYFDRFTDAVSLRQELISSGLANTLLRSGDRTLELR